jgi:hypothetical protein
MSSIIFLAHASNFKGNKEKMEHLIWIQFNLKQNLNEKYEGWHCTKSFHYSSKGDTCLLDFSAHWI